jgi:hypothetical protein
MRHENNITVDAGFASEGVAARAESRASLPAVSAMTPGANALPIARPCGLREYRLRATRFALPALALTCEFIL